MSKNYERVLILVLLVVLLLPLGWSPSPAVATIKLPDQAPTVTSYQMGEEIVGMRDQCSKVYYEGPNRYSADYSIGSVHYQDGFGIWQEIDNSWQVAQASWDWEMTEDGYHTRVLEDFTAGQILLFEAQGESVAFQPMALEWTNGLNQIAQISMPQNVAVSVSNEAVELLPRMEGSIGKIEWDNAYGAGRHFEWVNTPGRVKKLLILDSQPPAPPQYIIDGGSPVLRLNFIFDPSPALGIYIDGVLWDKKSTVQSFNTIEFKKEGEVLWGFMPAVYWDSSEEMEEGSGVGYTELRKVGNSLYVSVRVSYDWLQTVAYPVYIDPTLDLQVGAVLDDVYEREHDGEIEAYATEIHHFSNTNDWYRYWGAHRWVSGALPAQGDTITVAYPILYINWSGADDANGNWYFEKAASPAQFTENAYDVTGRTRTTNSVSWIQDSLGAGWKQIPSLVTPLQEVISSYSPTALALIFRPNSDTTKELRSYSYDAHEHQYAAKLHIEWTTGCSPSISLNTSSWSINGGSPVSENSNYSSGLVHFRITNNSGGAVTITIGGADMTGGGYTWDLADNGSPGDMVYGLYAGLSGGSYNIIVKETGPYNTLVSGLADLGTQDFGLKIYTPTNFDDGNDKSGPITLTTVCD